MRISRETAHPSLPVATDRQLSTVIVAEVYFDKLEVWNVRTEQDMTLTQLISNVGGQMGESCISKYILETSN